MSLEEVVAVVLGNLRLECVFTVLLTLQGLELNWIIIALGLGSLLNLFRLIHDCHSKERARSQRRIGT